MKTLPWKKLTVLACCAASPLMAAPVFNIDFESPNYTVGQAYSVTGAGAPTTNLPVLGSPNDISQLALTTSTGNTLTATVEAAGPTGNRLTFANTATGAIGTSAVLEAFAPQGVPGQTGTWFAQMDYTRLSSIGGPLLSMRLINDQGVTMLNHVNNNTLYADWWSGSTGLAMAVGVTNTLRVEIDMGTNIWRTYANGVLLDTYTNAGFDTGGRTFGGLQLGFNYGTSYAVGPLFSLDNIQVGSVPEPGTVGLFGLGAVLALGLILRRRRVF